MPRKRIHRRGRPRSNRQLVDTGTPELQRKRMLVSPTDATAATCPIDTLRARNLITPEHHAAAVHFRACRLVAFGSPHVRATNLLQSTGRDASRSGEREEAQYREACAMLRRMSPAHLVVIEDLVVHEIWPAWLSQPARKRAHACCREALDVLVRWHDGRRTAQGGLTKRPVRR
jgi:hypothetical protein